MSYCALQVAKVQPVAWTGCLFGAVLSYGHPGKRWGGQVCRDTILERKGPGLMPLSSVVPLYNGVVAHLNSGHLARVILALLGLECWFLSIVRRSIGS